MFADRVAAGAGTAVEYGPDRLSYRQLDQASAVLAARLHAAGAGPGAIVGVALRRGPAAVVAILAVARVGAAWLPLDPEHPAERLRYCLRDAGAAVVITDGVVDLGDEPVTRIDPAAAAPTGAFTPMVVPPGEAAYCIYTSGSTGRPKGVVLTQAGLANLIATQEAALGLGADTRMLQFATPAFDASVFEIACTLAVGGTLVIASSAERLDGERLVARLRGAAVTHALLPPSVLATLPVTDLPALRVLLSGGEALSGQVAARWAVGRRLINAYGPSETTVIATEAEVDGDDGARPPIGRPLPGLRAVVLGPDLRPVPDSGTGELAVGGVGVGRGYLNRYRLTAERFVPDADGPPGARLYRTGDLVRRLADGQLEFLGRIDHQVKVRGHRIELEEIAALLREHPSVHDAVAVVQPGPSGGAGDEVLAAYVTGTGVDPVELRAVLAGMLPGYMVPAALVVLPRMPLTASGKIDREALPPVETPAAGAGDRAPRNDVECTIAGLMSDLLGGVEPGRDDSFLSLGGHSLLVGRLAARIRAALGVEIPLPDIFAAPTVAGLAALAATSTAAPVLPPVCPTNRDRYLPLSFPQERVWFLEQLAPGNLAYNTQMTIRLTGPLDAGTLRATLSEIVRRHEILRTAFVDHDGRGVQRVLPPMPVMMPVRDLTGVPPRQRQAEAERLVVEALRAPFDLARPPLARWTLLRLAADDHMLVQVEHHFVHDGWSFAVLLGEIEHLYPALRDGRPVPLPAPPIQYGDFAMWQRGRMRGETLSRHVAHWTDRLAGVPQALDLPTDRPRPPRQTFEGDAVRRELPAELAAGLRRFARRHSVTLYAVMLAGFGALLRQYTRQTDLVIGAGFANRRAAELERMIGMVVNTLPLRLDVSGDAGLAELARRAQDTVVDASAWQDVPLDRVIDALGVARDASRNPLFGVMFSFHDSAVPDLDFGGLHGTVTERHNGSAKTDLNVVVIPRAEQRVGRPHRDGADSITLIWEYATALFDRATAGRMVTHYLTLLDRAVGAPQQPVRALSAMPATEREQVLHGWNAPAPRFPVDSDLPTLFAAQVAATPDAPALAVLDRDGRPVSVSYRELATRAAALAGRLARAGVGPGTAVGVLLPRGVPHITAHVATLRLGATVVPLDVAAPAARLAQVITAAGVRVVVTGAAHLPAGTALPAAVLHADHPEPGDPPPSPLLPPSPAAAAYVFLTSGSTGGPKPIALTHRGVLRLFFGTRYVRFEAGLRFGHATNPVFDPSLFELWGPLLRGGTVCVIPPDVLPHPAALEHHLRALSVDTLFLTTALFNEVAAGRPGTFDGLHTLMFGGEAAHAGAVRALLARRSTGAGPARLLNLYGPAETTTLATSHLITGLPDGEASVPIGRGEANTPVYLLDDRLEPVPVGVVGELYIGGPGVALGYLGRPARTAERFLPDPFGPAGARMYRTGDLMRWRADGTLHFVGRTDDQVKIRGFRIEPGEIRTALRADPAVADAAVLPVGPPGDQRLVAYVVLSGPDGTDAVARRLGGLLPAHLIPDMWVALDALPLATTGKLDRAALPTPEPGGPDRRYVPPGTGTEQRLARIWADLIGVDRVGRTDDFFRLGGHSLLATRLINQVEQDFGVDVRLADFLHRPELAALAALVDAGPPAPDRMPRLARLGAGDLLDRLDELSDAEVTALLRELEEADGPGAGGRDLGPTDTRIAEVDG
jgi:amino acid adenylation domain-containing protein